MNTRHSEYCLSLLQGTRRGNKLSLINYHFFWNQNIHVQAQAKFSKPRLFCLRSSAVYSEKCEFNPLDLKVLVPTSTYAGREDVLGSSEAVPIINN